MKPPRFDYAAPRSVAEALTLLHERGADAKVLAGGQSLVPLLNFRLARPALVIDLNAIAGLDRIALDPATGELVFGALVRLGDAERSPLVTGRAPLLAAALGQIGHRTIRNRGTVGGSLAHADPAAELPLVLLTLGGRLCGRRVSGERWMPADTFFTSYLTTLLEADELLVEARFSLAGISGPGAGWGFEEFSRRAGDFALAASCVTLRITGGAVTECAIAVAAGGPVPERATAAEAALTGRAPDTSAFAEAASLAAAGCLADGDIHASAEYRRGLVATLVARTLAAAAARASGA